MNFIHLFHIMRDVLHYIVILDREQPSEWTSSGELLVKNINVILSPGDLLVLEAAHKPTALMTSVCYRSVFTVFWPQLTVQPPPPSPTLRWPPSSSTIVPTISCCCCCCSFSLNSSLSTANEALTERRGLWWWSCGGVCNDASLWLTPWPACYHLWELSSHLTPLLVLCSSSLSPPLIPAPFSPFTFSFALISLQHLPPPATDQSIHSYHSILQLIWWKLNKGTKDNVTWETDLNMWRNIYSIYMYMDIDI